MSEPFKLKPEVPLEAVVLNEVLRFLMRDARVAWARRFNVGATRVNGVDANGRPTRRFVRFAFPGCSDILGQVVTGHFLAVETKRPGGRPTPEQAEFLASVNAAGGLGLIATSVADVRAALANFTPLATLELPDLLLMRETGRDSRSAIRDLLARHAK